MGGLFGGGGKVSIPEPPKPTPMADETAIRRRRKTMLSQQQRKGGRGSTILTEYGQGETLG